MLPSRSVTTSLDALSRKLDEFEANQSRRTAQLSMLSYLQFQALMLRIESMRAEMRAEMFFLHGDNQAEFSSQPSSLAERVAHLEAVDKRTNKLA
jgi:hypothetical protein